jgi:hypothetical protein
MVKCVLHIRHNTSTKRSDLLSSCVCTLCQTFCESLAAVIKKVDEFAVAIENAVFNINIQQFMATNFTMPTTEVDKSMSIIRDVMQLEYLAIVSPSFHIMFSVNTPDITPANGRLYNPAHILDYAHDRTVFTTNVLTYEELQVERPPLYRGRESNLDEAASGMLSIICYIYINKLYRTS